MTIRDEIIFTFQELLIEESGSVGQLSDETQLLDSGLDSLGLAILVVRLEQKLGFDPFTLSDNPVYPKTLGEFILFYKEVKSRIDGGTL